MRRAGLITAMLALACASARVPGLAGQGAAGVTPLGGALAAERDGQWSAAASQYDAILAEQPAAIGALIGMQHVLPHLGRDAELLPRLDRALAIDSTSPPMLTIAVQIFVATGHADSARRYVDRWATLSPRDEEPYRAWSDAAVQARDPAQAATALDLGRQRLGDHALALERATLMQRAGDASGAAREWVAAVQRVPVFENGAITMLAQVRLTDRGAVRDALQHDSSLVARQMLGQLLARWGDAGGGWQLLRGALPTDSGRAVSILRHFADGLHDRPDRDAQIAAAQALEAVADRTGGGERRTALDDAARAYATAGAQRDARRMLGLIGQTSPDTAANTSGVSLTMLEVLIGEHKPAEAEGVLRRITDSLLPDQRDAFRRRIAIDWIRAGDAERAAALMTDDSSTSALDIRGRLQLYRGNLAGAAELLKRAGPYDDDHELALERLSLLTMLQGAKRDTSIILGRALLALARDDSATAQAGLIRFADGLDPEAAAAVRLRAAEVALARHDTTTAVTQLHVADGTGAPASAAPARLMLARIDLSRSHADSARALLERLLLDFPESAAVPEARRLLDRLTGAIPARSGGGAGGVGG